MNRRGFLKSAARSAAALAGLGIARRTTLGQTSLPAEELLQGRPFSNAAALATRPFGHSDVRLSVIGFPGFAVNRLEPDRVARLVAESVERGVNYFDVSPKYGDAEARLGPALEPYRRRVFLACKTAERTAGGAAADLERSLERLRTDHLELYQLHHITDVARDVDAAFASGGAMEVLARARREGRVRFLGFSAHSVEAAMAAMDRFDFDSAMFAVNLASFRKGGFGPQILARAREKGMAVLALKILARQKWPADDERRKRHWRCWYEPVTDLDEAELSVRFTLGQPVTSALPPSEENLHRVAMMLAMDYRPLEPEEEARAARLVEGLEPIFTHAG